MNPSTQSKTASAPSPLKSRKQSVETQLKFRKRQIERELVAVAKTVQTFEDMKKEVQNASEAKAKLTEELTSIKIQLIKELGLA